MVQVCKKKTKGMKQEMRYVRQENGMLYRNTVDNIQTNHIKYLDEKRIQTVDY